MENIKRFWELYKFCLRAYVKGGLIGLFIGLPFCAVIVIVLMILGLL